MRENRFLLQIRKKIPSKDHIPFVTPGRVSEQQIDSENS